MRALNRYISTVASFFSEAKYLAFGGRLGWKERGCGLTDFTDGGGGSRELTVSRR